MKRRRCLGLVALAIATAACQATSGSAPFSPPPKLDAEIRAINTVDGIDANEARRIADIYRQEYVNGCGALLPLTLADETWRAGMLLGYAGVPSKRFVYIHSKSGSVWSDGGPRFNDLEAFRSDVVNHYAERRAKP